ncbi:hypothetical protein CCM_00259 [Cordyceps militaris CM01]|uniref:Uncharacterized protein n=1 Tax=Cordyceps militaris (strain CM01) TaxID=983644 RepID=G3J322_CORMM|nr:uncharacterized protein CCM_00259 [Cordyceps militaris CM01]EGX95605.1 hypothetical protein CCM_00259 [Cordyceps militaris CM01]
MAPTHRVTPAARPPVHKLPDELLVLVFAHFDDSSRLAPRFREDPVTLLETYHAAAHRGRGRHNPLKNISLVCHRWREVVLPRLFRHVLWTFRRLQEPEPGLDEAAAVAAGFELLVFLRRRRFGAAAAVEGLTMLVPCPEHLMDDPTELVGRFGLLPHAGVVGAEEDDDEDMAESVILSETASSIGLPEDAGHATWPNTWFWDMLWSVVDPLRVSIIAAPVVLATMLSLKVFIRCQPLLMTQYHIFSVSRADRRPAAARDDTPLPDPVVSAATMAASAPPSDDDGPFPCELLPPARSWSCLVVNEGSSVSIYKTNGYGQTPPSALLSLLAANNHRALRASLRRLEYVAVMPMATHLRAVAALVPPRLEALYVQIMPRGVDVGGGRFEGLDMEDLLTERDSVYELLFGAIFVPGPRPEWQALRVFETGDVDVDDGTAWAEAVETAQASASCWEVAEKGRLVRNIVREEAERRRRRRLA